jgi:hypothetical protein
MPGTTVPEMSPQEQAQMLATLRRARYGYLLALHVLLLCAAGRHPTEIAAFLFCSRSSVYRIVRLYQAGQLGFTVDPRRPPRGAGADHCPEPLAQAFAGGATQGCTACLWLVSHALELRHADRGTQD